jgi:hypothetical protein
VLLLAALIGAMAISRPRDEGDGSSSE